VSPPRSAGPAASVLTLLALFVITPQTQVYWNQVMAASLVVSVPVVVGFLLLQRYFVAGLTAGAVK
jgi:multiple sugar transport system permease protein